MIKKERHQSRANMMQITCSIREEEETVLKCRWGSCTGPWHFRLYTDPVKAVQTWTNSELEDDEICKNSAPTFFSSKTRAKKQNKKNCITFPQLSGNNKLEGDEIYNFFPAKKENYKNEFERFLFLCACANVLPASKTSAVKCWFIYRKILAYRPFWAHDIPDQCRPW